MDHNKEIDKLYGTMIRLVAVALLLGVFIGLLIGVVILKN